MADAILTLNAGSSSLKFSLFERAQELQVRLAAEGQVEGIGIAPHFVAKSPNGATLAERRWPEINPDYDALIEQVMSFAESHLGDDKLIAVGHRVVHGGPDHDRPQRVTTDLLTALDNLTPLAPLHEPHNIAPIRAIA